MRVAFVVAARGEPLPGQCPNKTPTCAPVLERIFQKREHFVEVLSPFDTNASSTTYPARHALRNRIMDLAAQRILPTATIEYSDSVLPHVVNGDESLPYFPSRFRFNSFCNFASGSVLITSSFVSQPLRAMPAPRRKNPACSKR